MIALQLAPVVLSLLLLGAHFVRAGNWILVGVVLVLVALLRVRRRWAAWVVQVGLLLGAAEWVRTLVDLVAWRSQAGEPMALLTAMSALVFRSGRLRGWYA